MTDTITRINELRLKVRNGEGITKEEAAEALTLMREARGKVITAQAEKEKKTKAPVNLNDLFG